MSKRILICLVGLPASGKTTLSCELIKRTTNYNIQHVCYDSHIKKVDHSADPTAWSKARQDVNNSIISMINSTKQDLVILLDDNFYYRGMRKEVYHIAQKTACVFGQLIFPVDTQLACEANKDRTGSIVTSSTIDKMAKLIEYPSEAWERHVYTLPKLLLLDETSLKCRTDEADRFINYLRTLEPEVNPADEELRRETERQKSLDNLGQQCDIILRKYTSVRMKADRTLGFSLPYQVYSDAKSTVLEKVRTGEISVDLGHSSLVLHEQFDILVDNFKS